MLAVPVEFQRTGSARRRDAVLPRAQAVEEFLDWQALDKARSPNTVRAYKQDLSNFVAYCADVGATTLAQVDRELLRAFQSDLARSLGRTAPLSAPTRHRRLIALRSFLKFCARAQWSPGDLGVTIDLPQLPRPAAQALGPRRAHAHDRTRWRRRARRGRAPRPRSGRGSDLHRRPDRHLPGRSHRPRRRAVRQLLPHRFRHTAGTLVQDELGDPLVTADYLGHHRLGSVAGYAEVSTHRREEANDALQRRGLSTWQPHWSRLRPTSREPALNDPMRFGRRREVIYVEERGAPYLTLTIGVVPNFIALHGLADDEIVGALAAVVFTMLVSANS